MERWRDWEKERTKEREQDNGWTQGPRETRETARERNVRQQCEHDAKNKRERERERDANRQTQTPSER